MAFEFKFPDIGEGIAEGELLAWKVKEGDLVVQDQTLAEMETDKAVVELPSPRAGRVTSLHAAEGDIVKVGAVLVTIEEDAAVSAAPPAAAGPAAAAPAAQAAPAQKKPEAAPEPRSRRSPRSLPNLRPPTSPTPGRWWAGWKKLPKSPRRWLRQQRRRWQWRQQPPPRPKRPRAASSPCPPYG